ncbi:MAG: hypothetical protein ACRC6U_09290 [Fusobacteriaceae bacterium]
MKITTKFREIKRITQELEKMKVVSLKVGIVGREADEPSETLTIREYATLNEYGTSNIPARPFFRTATEFGESKKIIMKRISSEVAAVINKNKDGEAALKAVGLFVKGRIQTSLRKGNWTPNAPSTIKNKIKKNGTLKPVLVDTGSMIKAIDFKIVKR